MKTFSEFLVEMMGNASVSALQQLLQYVQSPHFTPMGFRQQFSQAESSMLGSKHLLTGIMSAMNNTADANQLKTLLAQEIQTAMTAASGDTSSRRRVMLDDDE